MGVLDFRGATASGYPEICDITGLKLVEQQKNRKNVRKVTFWEKEIQRNPRHSLISPNLWVS